MRTATFVQDVESGVPVGAALGASYEAGSHPEIVRIATRMLATTGVVDMKQLATEAGVSRPSLYRRYPDRRQLESEIAAKGAEGMIAAAAGLTDRASVLRAQAEYLVDHPGEAAAIVPLAAGAPIEVLRSAAVGLSGNSVDTAWILGFAVIAAAPGRDEGDIAEMRGYIDEMVHSLS